MEILKLYVFLCVRHKYKRNVCNICISEQVRCCEAKWQQLDVNFGTKKKRNNYFVCLHSSMMVCTWWLINCFHSNLMGIECFSPVQSSLLPSSSTQIWSHTLPVQNIHYIIWYMMARSKTPNVSPQTKGWRQVARTHSFCPFHAKTKHLSSVLYCNMWLYKYTLLILINKGRSERSTAKLHLSHRKFKIIL